MNEKFHKNIRQLPLGSYYCYFKQSKYLLTKQYYAQGKIIKIYAQELKGNDIVSGNYYPSIKGGLLKPCEMSDKKVINFVNSLKII